MSQLKREKSCGAMIVRGNKAEYQVLMIRQNQGHWCFPKGHVENDETEIETAKREVLEETGLEIEILAGFRETTSYRPEPSSLKQVVYFIGKPVGGILKKQEIEVSDLRWVSIIDAFALLTYENDVELLRKLVQYLKINYEEDMI